MISICILNWNCCDILRKTIPVIFNDLQNVEHEIIIYDQNSQDESKDFLRKSNGLLNIKVVLGDKNSGNSVARNIMIGMAKYKYVVLLDSDIIPIKNSFKMMAEFMDENQEYAYIGYDFRSYTRDIEEATKFEYAIKPENMTIYKDKIAFSQYGMFRKSLFENLSFPEFYPFDGPGWGAEDNILGEAISEEEHGLGGMILGRRYFHNKSSSIGFLGMDLYKRMYIERYIGFAYFKKLSQEKKVESLKTKKLQKTKINCNTYYWNKIRNLGDEATDYLLKRYFHFLEFDPLNKQNLLMFGGSIFDHVENANQTNDANFKNVLYFGVGLSGEAELKRGKKFIEGGKLNALIVPRGPKTKSAMKEASLNCESACGDVLQLFSNFPISNHDEKNPELLVYDTWRPDLIKPASDNFFTVKVTGNHTKDPMPFMGLNQFLETLDKTSKVYSSQIHPTFLSAMLGKPVCLYQKDWRCEDFFHFLSFKMEMSSSESLQFRLEAQSNIIKFCDSFFKHLSIFS